jgi:hypothetical protein
MLADSLVNIIAVQVNIHLGTVASYFQPANLFNCSYPMNFATSVNGVCLKL